MLFSGKIPFHVAARLARRFWVPHLLQIATIRHCTPFGALFETIRTIRDYSLFAIRDYSLFAIRVFQTPYSIQPALEFAESSRMRALDTNPPGVLCSGLNRRRMENVTSKPWWRIRACLGLWSLPYSCKLAAGFYKQEMAVAVFRVSLLQNISLIIFGRIWLFGQCRVGQRARELRFQANGDSARNIASSTHTWPILENSPEKARALTG